MKMLKVLLITLLLNIMTYASEENPTKEEVGKLYVATFNRAPDSEGLDYWVNSSGLTLSEIAQSFFDQTETQELYPDGTSNRDFIQAVYNNLFNRDPDTLGWDYWETELDEQKFSKNRFIEAVINGATNSEDGQDRTIINNKNEIGLIFANSGLGKDDFPEEVLKGVTSNPLTLTFAKNIILSNNITNNMWTTYNSNNNSLFIEIENLSELDSRCKKYDTNEKKCLEAELENFIIRVLSDTEIKKYKDKNLDIYEDVLSPIETIYTAVSFSNNVANIFTIKGWISTALNLAIDGLTSKTDLFVGDLTQDNTFLIEKMKDYSAFIMHKTANWYGNSATFYLEKEAYSLSNVTWYEPSYNSFPNEQLKLSMRRNSYYFIIFKTPININTATEDTNILISVKGGAIVQGESSKDLKTSSSFSICVINCEENDNEILTPVEVYKIGYEYYKNADYFNAYKYFKKASEMEFSSASYMIGKIFNNKNYENYNQELAKSWFQKATEQGSATGARALGLIEYDENNFNLAYEWYIKSIDLGGIEAYSSLGYLFKSYLNPDKNYKKAYEWFSKAIDAGVYNISDAMVNIGLIYEFGDKYLQQDYDKSYEWYLKSANLGNRVAQYKIDNWKY